MDAPTWLNHKPIVSISDYDSHDGINKKNATDAKALSIGYAQYEDNKDISLKVWRHSVKKWSPQSEELPIHRVFDLASLYICVLLDDYESLTFLGNPKTNNLHGLESIKEHYKENTEVLLERIHFLSKHINIFLKRNNL